MEPERLDLIIFGASGFTGQYVVETMARFASTTANGHNPDAKGKEKGEHKSKQVSWGVAGRSMDKLKSVLDAAKKTTGYDIKLVKTIKADIEDQASLKDIASKCKVLLNCVGPYRFGGENVVRACVEEGTNYVDVSGEPEFLETIQMKYHDMAEKKGIYIIGSCGFDSVPVDLGVTVLQKIFSDDGGELNSVESYLEMEGTGKINHATWLSAIHGVANMGSLSNLRKEQKQKMKQIEYSHRLEKRVRPFVSKRFGGYFLPFPGADASVVRRSQMHFYTNDKIRPAQIAAYCKMGGWLKAHLMMLAAVIFWFLTRFNWGQDFLSKWASCVTFGYVTREGPKEHEMKNLKFTFYLVGHGWDKKSSQPDVKRPDDMNMNRVLAVRGTNPGYGATCVMMVLSALTILDERKKMPAKGGVYTPGAAFAKTSLHEKLNANGVTFEAL